MDDQDGATDVQLWSGLAVRYEGRVRYSVTLRDGHRRKCASIRSSISQFMCYVGRISTVVIPNTLRYDPTPMWLVRDR